MEFRNIKGEIVQNVNGYSWRPTVYGYLTEVNKLFYLKPENGEGCALPGGPIMLGETPPQSLERIFHEIAGYKVRVNSKPLHVETRFLGMPESGDFFQSLALFYQVARTEDAFRLLSNGNTSWKDLSELKSDDFGYIHRDFIRSYLAE